MRPAVLGWLRDDEGSMAFLVAFLLIPLFGFLGLAIDAARGYLLESRLSQALDAAALAGGRVMFDDTRDADIRKFFLANFPEGYLGARVSGPAIVADGEGERITVSASATINTTFMRLFDQNEMTVSARTVVQRSVRGMELVLVMDNTGSMLSGGKIDAMKAGASELVNILYNGRDEVPNFWVSLVPYTATVNIGKTHTGWLAVPAIGPGDAVPAGNFVDYRVSPQGWKGCVEARHMRGNDMTDATPSVEKFQPFFWASSSDNVYPPLKEDIRLNTTSNEGTGPNLGCGPAITPMVADRPTILAAIAEMLPWHRGGTLTNVGLAWGWRLLSPDWRGLWSAATPQLPLDYNTAYIDKAVVILTDGENLLYDYKNHPEGSDYTAYGRLGWKRLGTSKRDLAKKEADRRMSVVCQAMKQRGVVVFTITFQVNGSETRDLFRKCATKPEYYFNSPTNEQLRTAFRTIGTTLSNLRLAQ